MISNPVIDAIKARRSIRSYQDKLVPQELIDTIIEAGTWAPTACNIQPWKFTVIKGRTACKTISDKTKTIISKNADPKIRKRFSDPQLDLTFCAPLVIFISAAKSPFAAIDCNLAAENMVLAAYSLGLGSIYSGTLMSLSQDQKTKAELGITGNNEVYAAIVFGYPNEQPKASRNKPAIIKQIE